MTIHNIGLLGGSFNPPHNAHIAMALAAKAQLGLLRVDLMPAGQPWQKAGLTTMLCAQHRLAMCQAAIQGVSGLGVELCETQRIGNTYTVDTLRYLSTQHPTQAYTLIIGADQAKRLDSWHDWPALLELCQLALVARNGEVAVLPDAVAALCSKHSRAVRTIEFPAFDVSSSVIRDLIAAQQSIAQQVPAAVERYIVKHSLYKA